MIELCEATEENPFIHGMSKQFVKALQQLFDVIDSEQIGTIRFLDLANQWEENDGDPFFPKGLISCLAKVQLPNGLLTFDRFCAGIKLCLLKNQIDIKDIRLDETTSTTSATTSMTTSNNNSLNSPNNHQRMANSNNPPMIITDRPSSEPQIFAPPPPPSLSSSTNCHISNNEVNNNNIYNNKTTTISMGPQPLSPTIPSFNNSTISSSMSNNVQHHDENTTISNKSCSNKKLPLPSYEQVMAAKNKTKLPPPPSDMKQSTIIEESPTTITSKNTARPKPFPHLSPHQLEEIKRVVNHQYLESQYGTSAFNKGFNRQIIHANACRAKSMSHLDYMSHSDHHTIGPVEERNNVRLIKPTLDQQQQSNNADASNKSIDSNTKLIPSSNTSSYTTPALTQQQPKIVSRNCIMKTLQNWRDNILNKQTIIHDMRNDLRLVKNSVTPPAVTAAISSSNHIIDNLIDGESFNDIASLTSQSFRRSSIRRKEPRRHTVGANGIDLYAVKRFQQLEQEKEILIHGLNEVEKTKEWYVRQISSIQDKINFAGKCGTFPSDCNIDAYQERINFQAVRIQTLNQQLISLREAGQSFPIHMNLAIRPLNGMIRIDPNQPKQLVVNPNLVNKLKEQNRLLTDEVTRKSERITQLEREKSSLIRELFQARTYSSYYNGHFDDTLM